MVEPVDRRMSCCHDPGVAAADIERARRGEAVEETPAVEVPDEGPGPLRFDDVESRSPQHPDLLGVQVRGELLEGRLLGAGVRDEAGTLAGVLNLAVVVHSAEHSAVARRGRPAAAEAPLAGQDGEVARSATSRRCGRSAPASSHPTQDR